SAFAQESKDIPERYSRQVAPTPSTYWRAPDLRDYTRALKPTEAPLIDPNKRYGLPELIDLAQRVNPETRVAWEAARRSALAVGLEESEYFPALAISALGGYQSVGVPIPRSLVSDGFFRFDLAQAVPTLNLRWLLIDFGRRGSARDAAKERLLAANLGFNRKHQQIAFAVQRAFYGLTSVRARIAVAQSSLDAARVAALRASAAEVSRARAAYWPTLSLVGNVGSILGSARLIADGKSTGWFSAAQPSYGIGLALEWEVFDGGARRRRVELAESAR